MNVPVRVVPGLHPLFSRIFQGYENPQLLAILMIRQSIEDASETVQVVLENREAARRLLPSAMVDPGELESVSSLLAELAAALELEELRRKLRVINEDVLGAYFFLVPKIKIYWMAIGIVASLNQTSVEALTFFVLAHELAHGYTHVGYDIDEVQWETRAFADADLRIVEGLAQFYTQQVCVIDIDDHFLI